MSQRRSRLQRKAARVLKTETEQQFDEALGEILRLRNDMLGEARRDADKGLEETRERWAEARKQAYDLYQERRDELVLKFAAKEEAA